MKATQLLKQQHKEVKDLFKQIEDAEDLKEKKSLFRKLATKLVAHDAIEREIFYPACERNMGMTDELGEALVEHGQIEFSLYLTDTASPKDFDFKCTVLKEMVEHHVQEEEKEFFPKVEKAFDKDELESLAEEMEESFEVKIDEDFRPPLHMNLKQVLQGVLKPD